MMDLLSVVNIKNMRSGFIIQGNIKNYNKKVPELKGRSLGFERSSFFVEKRYEFAINSSLDKYLI